MKEIKLTTEGASKIRVAEPGEFTTGSVVPIIRMEEPEWGERVAFGTFLGEEQWVMRPLNRAAASVMEPSHMVALMLYDRVKELEGAIGRMESALEDVGIL